MADEDDLGNFFDEINQIEEVAVTEEPKTVQKCENTELRSSSGNVVTDANTSKPKAVAISAAIVKQCGPQIVSRPAELVVNNRAIYTYGVTSTSEGPVIASRETSNEIQGPSSGVSATFVADNTVLLSSSSSNAHVSIGPSIGPIGPPTGPRPPSSSAPTPSYSSGGLNLSLHSFSTSYVTSSGKLIEEYAVIYIKLDFYC